MKELNKYPLRTLRRFIASVSLPMLLFFGVIVPFITLAVECIFHLCGSVYVDPIPTWWHATAILFVAAANLAVWWRLKKAKYEARWLPYVIGASAGISLLYALVFAPIAPVAAIMVAFYGFGLLPLSPILAFVSAVCLAVLLRIRRKALNIPTCPKAFCSGIALGLAALVFAELPNAITDLGLHQAVSRDAAQSRAGIRLIRTFGSEQSLLRNCYHHTTSVSDIPTLLLASVQMVYRHGPLNWTENLTPISVGQSRQVYYRTYGKPFNSAPRPTLIGFRQEIDPEPWFWDTELAGEEVGGRTPVHLVNSQIATDLQPATASAYSEWMLTFQNNGSQQQEARMQIELPPDSVVSRATLWVNGQEKEAAFGERSLVRRAYQSVVASKRDPLLVTQTGPDRIMLQCFPVPPVKDKKPGEIKVRIGITSPCLLPASNKALLPLPRIAEPGFAIDCPHQIRVQSPLPVVSKTMELKATHTDDSYGYAGSIDDQVLRKAPIIIEANRPGSQSVSFTEAPLAQGKTFILEEIVPEKSSTPGKIFILIDGSKAMAEFMPDIAAALKKMPAGVPAEIRFASDEFAALVPQGEENNLNAVVNALTKAACLGGPDNISPLAEIWRRANKTPGSAVVWIHGPQPIMYDNAAVLGAFDAPNKKQSTLYDIEMYPAPNRLLEKIPPAVNYKVVPRVASVKDDLERLLMSFDGQASDNYRLIRRSTEQKPAGTQVTTPTVSAQLVSLWAYDETLKLINSDKGKDAVKLAAHQRLVTPVTGAVVLETAEDYKKNGLDPDNPDNNKTADPSPPFSIGAAPEPHEYALLIIALMVIFWQFKQQKRQRNNCRA